MPEFTVGAPPPAGRVPVPGPAYPESYLPSDGPNYIGRRIRGDVVTGAEPPIADKKILETIAEKIVGKLPVVGATIDVLFGGSKLNRREELESGLDPNGQPRVAANANQIEYRVNEAGELVRVEMLPMWNADP